MTMTRRAAALGTLALLAAGQAHAQGGQAQDPRPRSYALHRQEAPNFDLALMGGGRARRADYHGKTLVLYFGGLWCPDCIVDGPFLSTLVSLISGDDRLRFLQIHTLNRFGRWGSQQEYIAESGYSWPTAFDPDGAAAMSYAIEWFPTYLVIDPSRTIRFWRTDLDSSVNARSLFNAARAVSA